MSKWERSQTCQDMLKRRRSLRIFIDPDTLLIGVNTPPGEVGLIDTAGALTLQRYLAAATYESLQLGTSAIIPTLSFEPEVHHLYDHHGQPAARVSVAAANGYVTLAPTPWCRGDPAKIRDLADSLYRAADVAEQQRRS